MNDTEDRLEASDTPGKDDTVTKIKSPAPVDLEKTESASHRERVTSSHFKLDELELNKESIYKSLIYQKIKSSSKEFLTDKSDSRYKIENIIGEGATGVVFTAKDYNLNRDVAVKSPRQIGSDRQEVEAFIKEAGVTANLEHPNIVPIYDLDIDRDGNIYMSMRKIKGYSLKRYTDSVKNMTGTFELMTIGDILLIFLKVCDAVSYAHSKNQIHRDIKPENIMLGDFGEVFLIDWGSSSYNEGEVSVTPAYMSPEQALDDDADERSDIYCLSATLFHVLTLRLPTQAKTPYEMWTKKSQGIVDPLAHPEKKRLPAPLMAIVMKGLDADPEKRYQSIADLSHDLKQYQAGLAVSVFKDTLYSSFMRWYKRNKKSFWMSLFILFIVVGFGTYIWNEQLKEIAYWGKPIHVERFDNTSWKDKWVAYNGDFAVKDGRLVTIPGKGDSCILIYREKLYGSIAIEFEGEMMPDTLPCDLSLVWIEKITWDNTKREILNINATDICYLQTGAWDNSFSRIYKKPISLSYSKFTIKKGRKYKIRAEIDGLFLRILVDNKLICQYKGVFPLTSGYVGLYGHYPGKAFDNISIYCKGVAEKISPIQKGDVLFKNQLFEAAITEYEQVLRLHKGKKIADEALYKKGLCFFAMGKKDQAYKLWKTIKDGEYLRQATFHFWMKKAMNEEAHDQVIREMEYMFKNSNVQQQQEIINEWGAIVGMISRSNRFNSLDKYLAFRQKFFKDDISQMHFTGQILLLMCRYEQIIKEYPDLKPLCVEALIALDRAEEVLENYPDQKSWCINALLALGRAEEVLEKYPDRKTWCAQALLALGRAEEVLEKYPNQRNWCAQALLVLGRTEEVLEKYPDKKRCCVQALLTLGRAEEVLEKYSEEAWRAQALLALGRPKEVLEKYPDQRYSCANALLNLGRTEEVLEKYPDQMWMVSIANYCMGLKLKDEENKKREKIFSSIFPRQSRVFPSYLMLKFIYLPFTEYLINPKLSLQQRFKYALATKKQFGQELWFQSNFILGNITEEQFLEQPVKRDLASKLLLGRAMKADYENKKKKAIQSYTEYKALLKLKNILNQNPALHAFVEWRITEILKQNSSQ